MGRRVQACEHMGCEAKVMSNALMSAAGLQSYPLLIAHLVEGALALGVFCRHLGADADTDLAVCVCVEGVVGYGARVKYVVLLRELQSCGGVLKDCPGVFSQGLLLATSAG